jgi:carbamoyltransferase
LLRDGQLVAAAEEERFRRVKHWAGLPSEAIDFCLREARLQLADVDHVAINRNPRVNNLRRLVYVLSRRPSPALVLNRLRNIRRAATVEAALGEAFPGETLRARVHHVEHHLAHLASAFLVSPFEAAVCVSVDGFGDFASAAWGMGQGNEIRIDGRVYFPHSLGIFYSAITQHLGFRHFGDEYKVMGLAPYGEPKFIDAMRQIVLVQPDGTFRLNLKLFRHHTENVAYNWNNCAPEVGTLYTPELERLLGPKRAPGAPLQQRQKDIARSAQAMYEEAFFALLNALYEKYRCPNLAMAGGCAMNSVANGKVYARSPFKKMYLPAAAGDAGGAIGAAFAVHHKLAGTDRRPVDHSGETNAIADGSRSLLPASRSPLRTPRYQMTHAYWGPAAETVAMRKLIEARVGEIKADQTEPDQIKPENCVVEHIPDEQTLCERTARAISEGKVVGWFQGRMEWGPRALGNRSILGDPRRADMKDILNQKIKRRESFRPFAPSILRESVAEWFETDDDVPFMMQVFQVRAEQRSRIPAVCHVDGSGRLQTVHKETNPLYHLLVSNFHRLTGVPMILNTSFNENEPVVCRPEEALDCFLRTRMDILVLGSFFVARSNQPGAGSVNEDAKAES